MSAERLAALAAFLSGMGSVIGGIWAIRGLRKRDREECDRRVAELRAEFERGYEHGKEGT